MALDVYKDWLGIPEEFRPPDHYQLLRLVEFEDDEDKIRKNYKKLNSHVRKYATGQYSVESQELLNELAKVMLLLTDPQRKRDYDESLGREFAEEEETGKLSLGKHLVKQGHLNNDQLKEAEQFANQRGLSMRDAVVQMKLTDFETATKALAVELGFSYVDLSEMTLDESLLDSVPRNLVKRNSIVPLFIDEDMLLVACVDEPTHELEDELRLTYGVSMRPVIATPTEVNECIETYYSQEAIEQREAEAEAAEIAAAEAAEASGEKPVKKGGAKSTKKGSAKAQPAKKLTEEEKKQQKMMGYMIMMWSAIGSVMLSQFIPIFKYADSNFMAYLPVIIAVPAAAFYVTQVYWKK